MKVCLRVGSVSGTDSAARHIDGSDAETVVRNHNERIMDGGLVNDL